MRVNLLAHVVAFCNKPCLRSYWRQIIDCEIVNIFPLFSCVPCSARYDTFIFLTYHVISRVVKHKDSLWGLAKCRVVPITILHYNILAVLYLDCVRLLTRLLNITIKVTLNVNVAMYMETPKYYKLYFIYCPAWCVRLYFDWPVF